MNSTILCWPTLAPLFLAMNRAVWKKKKIHTLSESSKICLFVMVSRLGEKVVLHLVLFYIFLFYIFFQNRKYFLAREEPVSKH